MTKRAFPLLAGAVGISAFGDMVAIVPIALHLQERSGSGVIVAIGARWTLFLAGALPFVAGLAGLALHSRRRQVDEAPATVTV